MNEKKFPSLAFLLIILLWVLFLFYVPTFDLDESLYRRVAEEMKTNHQWWHPTWDGDELFHKPPFFYWLIVAVSQLFDAKDAGVSIFSARLPSFLASLGILFSLFHFYRLSLHSFLLLHLYNLSFF